MPRLQRKSFATPDEVREFPNGRIDVVRLDEIAIGRYVLQPGWQWAKDVKPIAGTSSCQVHHTGFCISGRMTVRSDDGEEITIGPGDVIDLDPGHDAWTLGEEPCVLIDTGVAAYAKPS